VDPPLPASDEPPIVAIATGFVFARFENNTIEARGGSVAAGLVWMGNHFGTRVTGNRLIGCGEAFKIGACASESPVHWGWSHTPFLAARIENNTIEEARVGGRVIVEHGKPVKSTRGRVYLSGWFQSNHAIRAPRTSGSGGGFVLGEAGSRDPAELVITSAGNTGEPPPGAPGAPVLRVESATVNGQAITARDQALPARSTPLATPATSPPR
jgi:hypothetical protein